MCEGYVVHPWWKCLVKLKPRLNYPRENELHNWVVNVVDSTCTTVRLLVWGLSGSLQRGFLGRALGFVWIVQDLAVAVHQKISYMHTFTQKHS